MRGFYAFRRPGKIPLTKKGSTGRAQRELCPIPKNCIRRGRGGSLREEEGCRWFILTGRKAALCGDILVSSTDRLPSSSDDTQKCLSHLPSAPSVLNLAFLNRGKTMTDSKVTRNPIQEKIFYHQIHENHEKKCKASRAASAPRILNASTKSSQAA